VGDETGDESKRDRRAAPARRRPRRTRAIGVSAALGIATTFAVLLGAPLSQLGALPLPPAPSLPLGSGAREALRAQAAVARGELAVAPPPRFAGVAAIDGKHGPAGYVAFTFDDGPSPLTPKILATLAAHGTTAAFFVCGYRLDGDSAKVQRARETLRAAAAAGHLIGNHTFAHQNLELADRAGAAGQILANERAIDAVLGEHAPLFRPPYGQLSTAAAALTRDLGLTVVRWSIDIGDFKQDDAGAIRRGVVEAIVARGGGVVLLHDVNPATVAAFPGILADLERENCARRARGAKPILPVSLDVFAQDGEDQRRPLSAEALAWAASAMARLDGICPAPRTR
jgi:peptidoglycan/xylan/chitin deacetylase (PgdA/CDA1 family)